MSDDVEATLPELGIADERIHVERFVSRGRQAAPEEAHRRVGSAEAHGHADRRRQAPRRAGRRGEAILDAALRAGMDLPFACKGGMCSTCRAKLVEGDAEMEVNYSLEPWELKAGFVLTCQARPMCGRWWSTSITLGRIAGSSTIRCFVRTLRKQAETGPYAQGETSWNRLAARAARYERRTFARRYRPRLRGRDVEGRRRQPGSRHENCRGEARIGDADDDGGAAHGQRSAHRRWRLHFPAGDFDLRLCLQLPQRARGRRAMRHRLHRPGKLGDVLVATAREISRTGRSGFTTFALPPARS